MRPEQISASDIPELARAIRVGKHQDPIKGMVAVNLYDSEHIFNQ